jgi:hypothetical protein
MYTELAKQLAGRGAAVYAGLPSRQDLSKYLKRGKIHRTGFAHLIGYAAGLDPAKRIQTGDMVPLGS